MKHALTAFIILLTLGMRAQTLTAQDMLMLAACKNAQCYTNQLKPLGFKYVADTALTTANKTYTYISKRSVAPKKQKNHVACIMSNNGMFNAVMFKTVVEQMQRRLLNSFVQLGFSGGFKQYGDREDKITYTCDFYPYTDLTLITTRNTEGTRVVAYTFVLTKINK